MQRSAQQDVAGPLAGILGIDQAEMDLALVPQAGLRDRLARPIEQVDLASARRERQGGAGSLDAGAQYRDCLGDRSPPD
jgi:hypothetical protein